MNAEMQRKYRKIMKKMDSIEETIFDYEITDEDYHDITFPDDRATNDYMLGMYNGAEAVHAILEDRDIEFLQEL